MGSKISKTPGEGTSILRDFPFAISMTLLLVSKPLAERKTRNRFPGYFRSESTCGISVHTKSLPHSSLAGPNYQYPPRPSPPRNPLENGCFSSARPQPVFEEF